MDFMRPIKSIKQQNVILFFTTLTKVVNKYLTTVTVKLNAWKIT